MDTSRRRRPLLLLAALLALTGFWVSRHALRSPVVLRPAASSALPAAAPDERIALTPAPDAARLGPRPPPLHRAPQGTDDWVKARTAYAPPSPRADPSRPPPEQVLLVSGPIVLPTGTRAQPPAGEASARGTKPFVVQADSADGLADRAAALREAGAHVYGYLPHNAWLVELDDAARVRVEVLPFVRATLAYAPTLRIQPWLAQAATRFVPATTVLLSVQTFLPEDAEPVALRLRKAGGTVRTVTATPGRRSGWVTAEAPLGLVGTLATWAGVQWIEEHLPPQCRNELATAAGHLSSAPLRAPWALDGADQTVGHADTGLDTGNAATVHRDVRGRVTATGWARSGVWSDPDGHGTHTAGSIVGNGTMSGGRFAGAAPAAHLFHQSVGDAAGDLTGLTDLYALFEESYTGGARVHSDSWGVDDGGQYASYSQVADEFAWDHPEFLPVFSAGNAGVDANSDGVVDAGSVGSPATAKNALAIGATESDRAPGTGGFSSYTYGSFWPTDFPASPLSTDKLTWSASPGPPYLQGMAAFSARGPAADGRVKPDLVAPGCEVASLRTSVGLWPTYDWPQEDYPADYTYNMGTSMATPLVAGTAALLRQALARVGQPTPTAALLRAMLAGGARSLAPGQYTTTLEIPTDSPNSVEGHGQVDLARTLFPEAGLSARVHDRLAPAEGTSLEIPVELVASGLAFRVVLAWSDPPATSGAGLTRINDLDLSLLTPSGATLRPTTAGGGTDILNTLERIDLATAPAGTYTVRVSAVSLPYPDPARFVAALYLRGAFDAPPVLYHAPGNGFVPATGGTLPVAVSAHYHRPLAAGEALVRHVFTAHGETPAAEAVWSTNALSTTGTIVGGWSLGASLPCPALHQVLHYSFVVQTGTQTVLLPTNGTFALEGYAPVLWTVAGAPDAWGTVSPDYGEQAAVPGLPITASASPTSSTGTGHRVRCLQHVGEGGIPSGTAPELTFTLAEPTGGPPARLTWVWQAETALTQTSEPQGALDRVDWFADGTPATTAPAPEVAWDTSSTPYALTGWWVDGARWPAAAGASPNPASGIAMSAPRAAVAHYAPFWDDADGNGLRDAWELRWTGQVVSGLYAFDDEDFDGWTNLGEDFDNTDPSDAGSFPTPPVIADITVFANPMTTAPPWTVEATITDNFHVNSADLLWRLEGAPAWNTAVMQALGSDRFAATFDPGQSGAFTSEYCIVAADVMGTEFPEFAVTSGVLRVWAVLPGPRIAFEPSAPWWIEGGTAPTTQSVAVVNYGGGPLDYSLQLIGEANRYEQNTPTEAAAWGNGSTSATTYWRRATRRSTSGGYAWYCGNTATWRYDNGVSAWLDTPPFTVGTNAMFGFDQWIATEHDSGVYYWDGGVLRISTDGGWTWQSLEPVGGYPHRIVSNPDSPFDPDQPCFGGRGEGWQTVYADLSAFVGASVIVRFEFGSDLYEIDEGWYIDRVRVLDAAHPAVGFSLNGAIQGTLGFRAQGLVGLRFEPAALPTGQYNADGLVLALHNDPLGQRLLAVAARYGFTVAASASGPGGLSFDRAVLYQGQSTTLVAVAGSYADVRSVATNGVSWAPPPRTAQLALPFANLAADQNVSVQFDWTTVEGGVPLWWLGSYGWTGNTATAAYADPDGDGALNWEEYVANTSPTNGLSRLRLHAIERVPAGLRLRWIGGPQRTSVVERAATPSGAGPWTPGTTLRPVNATEYETTVDMEPTAGFFRIRVLPPTPAPPP